MLDSTFALSSLLAGISLPAMAALAAACVALALLRKDDLPQGLFRAFLLFATAGVAVWLTWKLSSADWWTAVKSVLAFACNLVMIVLGANGLARLLSHEDYNSGQEATELMLEINPFAVIGAALGFLGIVAILFIDWLAVAAVVAVAWIVVVAALLLAQYLSLTLLDASEASAKRREHDRMLQKAERKRLKRTGSKEAPPPVRPLVATSSLRSSAACAVALSFGIGASLLMLRT